MKLEGSCHCGAVRFTLQSATPQPYMLCYCSICRKTAGGGGYAINLGGDADSLEVEGEEHISIYQARQADGEKSQLKRHFCKHCATALWCYDSRWPELIHPFASAIDTELPVPPERVHIMLDSKPAWVQVTEGPKYAEYPEDSIAQWHEKHGLTAP